MSEDRPTYDGDYRSSRALAEDQFVTVHWRIAKAFGLNEAAFIGYLLPWGASRPGQWVYRTADEIEHETCLTRRQQETARAHLKAAGALDDRVSGLPARLFFHINWDVIERAMEDTPSRNGQIGDPAQLDSHFVETGSTNQPNRLNKNANHIKEVSKEKSNSKELVRPYGAEPPAPKRKASRISEDWMPSPEIGERSGLAPAAVAAELDKFRDHFLANGKTMLDWDAAWRNWLRRAQDEFAPRQGGRPRLANELSLHDLIHRAGGSR